MYDIFAAGALDCGIFFRMVGYQFLPNEKKKYNIKTWYSPYLSCLSKSGVPKTPNCENQNGVNLAILEKWGLGNYLGREFEAGGKKGGGVLPFRGCWGLLGVDSVLAFLFSSISFLSQRHFFSSGIWFFGALLLTLVFWMGIRVRARFDGD